MRHIKKEPKPVTSLRVRTTELVFYEKYSHPKSPGFPNRNKVCLKHLALGDTLYLQSVNPDLKQPGLLPLSSRKMKNNQFWERVVEPKTSYRITPTLPQLQQDPHVRFSPTKCHFFSDYWAYQVYALCPPGLYTLSWLIKRMPGNLTL